MCFLEAAGKQEILCRTPLAGPAGQFWLRGLMEPFGLRREDVLIANVLRCHPPKNTYPTGKLRDLAEHHCRQYDEAIRAFSPNLFIVTFHPAAILRTPAYYEPTKRAVEKALGFLERGFRPCLLMGDKAAKLVFPIIAEENLTRWQGHWFQGEWP